MEDQTAFSVAQVEAVRAAFSVAGWDGTLRTLPVDAGGERLFVLPESHVPSIRNLHALERVLSQLLGTTAFVLGDRGHQTVPFA